MFDAPRYNPQVLIVEDEPSIRELMKLVVENENHWQPTTVETGAHAVEAWDKGDFSIILMDLKLPLIDGIEAAKIIRDNERRSGRRHTPIIAFTGLVTPEDRQACVEAGFDDFIAKPANMRDVIDTVYRFLPENEFL